MSESTFNHTRLYWIFQVSGWTLFFVFYTSTAFYFYDFHPHILLSYLNTVLVGFTLTHVFRRIIKNNHWDTLSIAKLTLRIILSALLVGIIWAGIVLPINNRFFPGNESETLTIAIGIIVVLNLSIVMVGWSIIYFLYKFFTNFRSSEIEKWKLQAAVKDAELIALKSQINPHFIFNCLNNIRSLVIENPEKAREMINHISDLLRYSIQFNNREKVSLKQELEIVKNYLKLESIQFEDRLKYTFEITPETLELQIPPMSIQLLVENAIKHGISNLPKGGEISIRSNLASNNLIVEVLNSGQINNAKKGTGIGLKNASDRLKLLFGKTSYVQIRNINGSMVKASFKIPLI